MDLRQENNRNNIWICIFSVLLIYQRKETHLYLGQDDKNGSEASKLDQVYDIITRNAETHREVPGNIEKVPKSTKRSVAHPEELVGDKNKKLKLNGPKHQCYKKMNGKWVLGANLNFSRQSKMS